MSLRTWPYATNFAALTATTLRIGWTGKATRNAHQFSPSIPYDLYRIAGNARSSSSFSASRCRSACVGGSGPQILSTIASLNDVTA
jgi:hypothetical protein